LKYNAYIFDFDGTLVDSMPHWSAKMLNILDKNNITYPPDIIKKITPLGDLGTANYFKEVLGVKLSIEEMIAQMDAFALPRYRDIIELKDGVFEYLKMLRENKCSLNVLTASPHKMVDPCLKRNGIFELFDNVWSCDDFGTTKSNPQIYTEAIRRIGSKTDEAVFFDDNINAIKSAAEAGLLTVGVYDESGKDFEEELREFSDVYIESFVGLNQF